jgi:multidrug transporter EmrE-like cation transporter
MTSRLIAHLYLAATVATTVYSQLVIKWRISGRFAGLKVPEGILPKIVTLFTVLFDPFIFSGLVATFVSGLCWMATMSKLEIGYAYPFTSLGFVLVVLLSGWLFGESLNAWRISGVILIVAGITVASQGAK